MTNALLHLKVLKLLRHEESARSFGSRAEADAFRDKALHLIHRYKLNTSGSFEGGPSSFTARYVTAQSAGLPTRSCRQEWTERLAAAIAQTFGCQLRVSTGTNTVVFAGLSSSCEAAGVLYEQLASAAWTASREAYALWKESRPLPLDANMTRDLKIWRRSFLLGFVDGLGWGVRSDLDASKRLSYRATHASTDRLPADDARTFLSTIAVSPVAKASRAIGGGRVHHGARHSGQTAAFRLQLRRSQAA